MLQDFERRLEGAVEGFFARTFRSGLQPIELAKALQRYADDTKHVAAEGVIVPNVFRFRLSGKDIDRFETFGAQLPQELADVVNRTASERGWMLRGPAHVQIQQDDQVTYGTYELEGKVEVVEGLKPAVPDPPTSPDLLGGVKHSIRVEVSGDVIPLKGARAVAGRLPGCEIQVDDTTVSREHAAFVRRGDEWWVIDLGSTNGTRVNGVAAAEQPLRPGDEISLGEALLEFVEG